MRFSNVGHKTKANLYISMLKNPERGNQIVQIGKLKFSHLRPISIDREEKKILSGSHHYNEYMETNIYHENTGDVMIDDLKIIFNDAAWMLYLLGWAIVKLKNYSGLRLSKLSFWGFMAFAGAIMAANFISSSFHQFN